MCSGMYTTKKRMNSKSNKKKRIKGNGLFLIGIIRSFVIRSSSWIQSYLFCRAFNCREAGRHWPKGGCRFLSRARSITRGDIRKALSDRYLFQISEWGVKYATLIFDRYGILDKHPFELKDLRKVGAEIRTINHGVDDEENLIWNSDRLIYSKRYFQV